MRNTTGFTSFRTLAVTLAIVAVGFAVTRIATSAAKTPSSPKNGGIDNAMQQARKLMAELSEANWNPREVDQSLLRLPEQDYAQNRMDRLPQRDSFIIPSKFQQYDEVAFYCDTFISRKREIVKGREAELTVTGFFIVGWKDGVINTVDVADVRLVPLPGVDNTWFHVFPGMNEYDAGLKYMSGTRGARAANTTNGDGS